MRRAYLSLLVCVVSACGEEPKQPDESPDCEGAVELTVAAIEDLRVRQPACSTDEDCVDVSVKVHGGSVSLDLCSSVLHREAAAKWDPAAFGELLAMRFPAGAVGCSVYASCIGGHAVCRASKCTRGERHAQLPDERTPVGRLRDGGLGDPVVQDAGPSDAVPDDASGPDAEARD